MINIGYQDFLSFKVYYHFIFFTQALGVFVLKGVKSFFFFLFLRFNILMYIYWLLR